MEQPSQLSPTLHSPIFFSLQRSGSMKRRVSHRFCPHCNKDLNLKSFKYHKKLYFQSTSGWTTTNDKHSEPLMPSDSSDDEIDSPPVRPASELNVDDEAFCEVQQPDCDYDRSSHVCSYDQSQAVSDGEST